jgi:serine/threonine protein kinase
LKEQYRWEKRELTTELKQLKKNLRVLKTSKTRLQRSLEAMMEAEQNHRNDLQELKVANKKLQEQHNAEVEAMQLSHASDMKILETNNRELKDKLRVLESVLTRLNEYLDTKVKTEEDLRKELQAIEATNKKLQEQHNAEMEAMQLSHAREKKKLLERNKLLKNDLRVLKISNTRQKKGLDTKVKTEEDLRKELQAIEATNKKLQEQHNAEMEAMQLSHANDMKILETNNRELNDKLRALESANTRLNEYLDTKVKIEEDLRKELQAIQATKKKVREQHNSEMDMKILEARKSRVAADNTQCGKQQIQRGGISDKAENSLNGFDLIDFLGKGDFGTVVLAERKGLGEPKQLYAIKAIQKLSSFRSYIIRQAMVEKDALILASGHPFIVTLHSCFQNEAYFFLVMDYVDGGDLMQQKLRLWTFSEIKTQFYAAEITLALQFLHKQGIVHRDLKPANVLIGSDGHCKVTDFGLAKLGLFDDCQTWSRCGTQRYMAPEMVKGSPYGKSVDWWALGIMIYEMLVGTHPYIYNGEVEDDMDDWIVSGRVVYPKRMSRAAVSLVTNLLIREPTERLGANGSVDTIRKHPFFEGLDWVALEEKRVAPPDKPILMPRKLIDHTKTFRDLIRPAKRWKYTEHQECAGFSFKNPQHTGKKN